MDVLVTRHPKGKEGGKNDYREGCKGGNTDKKSTPQEMDTNSERERERERERQSEREQERDRERETERDKDRDKEIEVLDPQEIMPSQTKQITHEN